ncbi:hypothetical protein FHS27_003759 [Rhodopirellula rubra]|uniref:Uncharacterized protein n=1 Tax=Aporhodopirellula rubra TaxID=980271 RepID=A0A7W5E273_9BACT|nr:hypothetical protein [Aporhodopirellula rubra]MBB3207932.1 hypothetical protein [Aporhodopirellula rubra]
MNNGSMKSGHARWDASKADGPFTLAAAFSVSAKVGAVRRRECRRDTRPVTRWVGALIEFRRPVA